MDWHNNLNLKRKEEVRNRDTVYRDQLKSIMESNKGMNLEHIYRIYSI